MTDSVIGSATIEVIADARKLKAGIEDAKQAIRTLGDGQKDVSASASQSIDKYIGRLQTQNATLGMSTRETEIYKLALRGASDEQLKSADAILKLGENHRATAAIVSTISTGLIAAATAATAAAAGLAALVVHSIDAAAHLQDLNKSTGISVENLAGLSLLAKESGTDIDSLAKMVNKMSVEMGKAPDKFVALGITAKDGVGALKQFSDIFNLLPDIQQRNALAQEVFKKSWAELAPLLALGGDKIGEVVAKGTELSGITTELAAKSKLFKEQLDELELVAARFGTTVAADMVSGLTNVVKGINEAYQESGKLAALWRGMGALGAFLYTDEFASARVKLKTLGDDLKDLETTRAGLERNAPGGGFISHWFYGDKTDLDSKIANTKAQIAGLLKSLEPPKPAAGADPVAAAAAAAKAAAFLAGNKPAGASVSDWTARDEEMYKARVAAAKEIDQLETDAAKRRADEDKMFTDARAKVDAQGASEMKTLNDSIKAQELYNAEIGKTKDQKDLARKAIEDAATAQLQFEADALRIAAETVDMEQRYKDIYNARANALDAEVAGRKKLSGLLAEGAGLDKIAEDAKKADTAAKEFGQTMETALDRTITGSLKGKDAVLGLAQALEQMAIKLAVLEPFKELMTGAYKSGGGLSGIFSSLFGGGPNYVTGGAGASSWTSGADLALGSFATGTDFVPQTGLYQLHRGESVAPAGSGGAPNVVVQVINQTGQPVSAKQSGPAQWDGSKWVLGVFLDAFQNNPSFRNAVGGR